MKNKQKQLKIKEKNQISTIKESGKQITESNEVAKNDFNIDKSGVLLEKQKEIFNRLSEERAFEFSDVKSKIDLITCFMYLKLREMSQKILEIPKRH